MGSIRMGINAGKEREGVKENGLCILLVHVNNGGYCIENNYGNLCNYGRGFGYLKVINVEVSTEAI